MDEEPLMRWFTYAHLPERLREVSRQFHRLAVEMVETLPSSPERTVCLRKLLESKDAAVRAAMDRI